MAHKEVNQGRKSCKPLWDESLSTEVSVKNNVSVKEIADSLSVEQREEMLKLLVGDKEERWGFKEKLAWNEDEIFAHLRHENYVKIEEDAEMMWYKWRKVCIDLPAVWEFGWYKFECFIWKDLIDEEKVNQSELNDKCYSRKEIWDFLVAFNRYMHEYWVDMGSLDPELFEREYDGRHPISSEELTTVMRALRRLIWKRNNHRVMGLWYLTKDICEGNEYNGMHLQWNYDEASLDGLCFDIDNFGYLLLNCLIK